MARSFAVAFAAALVSSACGGSSDKPAAKVASGPEAPPKEAKPEGRKLPVDLAGWQDWAKTNREPFISRGHDRAMVDVYVTTDHAWAYLKPPKSFPVGMGLVKAQYDDDDGKPGEPRNLAVMIKMKEGFDPEHGDWYYGLYSFDGKKVQLEGKAEGKTELCANCHETAETDYVFGPRK